jgi:aspartyl-tRNA(Asn)/glutamyl-tRNA(Gln) amidotransferase subunit A
VDAPRTVTAAAAALRAGEVTSTELVEQAIAAADRLDARFGTFLDRYADSSRAAAAAADALLASGAPVGPLTGVPLGIKDMITTCEGPTTAMSLVHDPEWNGRRDAVAVARLRRAGGIVMGKTTTAEFAIGEADEGSPFPQLRNPWAPGHHPGGSSSGTGSGVATGQFLAGLGTDTGGSIRIPAAFCGISGLMPTYGRVPKSGCVPLAYSMDRIGPMARTAADCALLLSVLAGADPSDPSSVREPVDDYPGALTGDLTGLRIGVDDMTAAPAAGDDPAVPGVLAAAVAVLRAAGAEVVDVRLPLWAELNLVNVMTMFVEAATYHQPDFERQWSRYGKLTRSRIAAGLYYSATDFVQAQRVRRVGMRRVAELFDDVDLVVTPTVTAGAPPLVQPPWRGAEDGGTTVRAGYWNATGHPALSVPMGFTGDGLPLGLQIAGRPFEESTVLRAGDAFQQRTDWHLRVPEPAAAVPVG